MNAINTKVIPKQQSNQKASTNPALTVALKNQKQRVKRRRKQRNGNNNNNKKSINPNVTKPSIHECVVHYGSALADPVGTPLGACVPWGFPTPTQKFKTFIRGTFQLGTTGKGWALTYLVPANNNARVLTTTNASVGTNATGLGAFTGTVANVDTKLPWSQVTLEAAGNGMSWRPVAQCLRIRYAGTEANRNGIVTTLESPGFQDLGQQNFNSFSTLAQAHNQRPSPDGSWHSVCYSGPCDVELADMGKNQFTTIGLLLCYVQGIAGDLYEYECYTHYEFAGSLTMAPSMSHSDAEGYARVLEATKSRTVSSSLHQEEAKSIMSEIFKQFGTTATKWIRQVGYDTAMSFISSQALTTPLRIAL